MPALSPTMTQGNIGAWKKNVGDAIQPGDVLVEIETDKAQMEFECQEDGFLARILMPEGTKEALVGKPLAIMVEKKEDVDKFKNFTIESEPDTAVIATASGEKNFNAKAPDVSSAKTEANKVEEKKIAKVPSATKESDRIFASPLARNTAKDMDINLSTVSGSGPRGRIIKDDVVSASSTSSAAAHSHNAAYTDTPLTNIRKVIAGRLSESKQTIPHYYLSVYIVMDNIAMIREKLNLHGRGAYKLSVNDFVIKAAARAMGDVPAVNSAWQGNFIREYQDANISVAVAAEAGLITPIINQANLKGLLVISNEMKGLVQKAKENKLRPEQFQGGSFTISNLGMYGIQNFTAIINPPQSCILAVGGSEKRFVPDERGQPMAKSMMTVTMSCDHRVVDGATGARWLQHFKAYMEDPITILL